jgi:ssDNA thymidine ADP-ribosyltransferase, DarT
MLYMIYKDNHPEITYRGGQGPIIHLEADLTDAVAWANLNNRRWAFTLSNAGAAYTQFRSNLEQLDEIDWNAVSATDWRASEIREAKQAECLVQGSFPWELVERVGVESSSVLARVRDVLGAVEQPIVEIKRDWYY